MLRILIAKMRDVCAYVCTYVLTTDRIPEDRLDGVAVNLGPILLMISAIVFTSKSLEHTNSPRSSFNLQNCCF